MDPEFGQTYELNLRRGEKMKIKYLILVAGVSLLLFFGGGIGSAFAQHKALSSLEEDITNLVESIKPSLVTIETENHIGSLEKSYIRSLDKTKGTDIPATLVGSGIIYTADGYILTTASVVGGMLEIPPKAGETFKVTLPDGKVLRGKLIGTDDQSNVAVLKVEEKGLTPAKLGNSSQVKVGSWLTVVGNSFGLPHAVNLGLVNGLREDGFIQMSATVSPGNSGGPVLDTYGRVIGLVSAKLSESSYIDAIRIYEEKTGRQSFTIPAHEIELPSSGVSLALPINKVKIIADDIIKHGSVERGYLGIYPEDLDEVTFKKYNVDKGVWVSEVVEESPAEKAGFLKNDIILEFGGKGFKNAGELRSLIQNTKPNEKVRVEILRDGKKIELTAVMGKATPPYGYFGEKGSDFNIPKLDVSMPPIEMPEVVNLGEKKDEAYNQLKEELKRLSQEMERLNREIERLKQEKSKE
jgi:serine protease Do